MEILLGFMFFAGLAFAANVAVDHVRQAYRASQAAAVKKTAKANGQHKRAALRQDRAAFWTREVTHLFPITRTGFHTGWLAHQTATAQHRARREEARTSHLDARASIADGLREHRERQQAALKKIQDASEPQPAAPAAAAPANGNGHLRPVPTTPNGGTRMAGNGTDGTYTDVHGGAAEHASAAEAALADYRAQLTAAQARLDGMEASGVDQATLADQADLVERLRAAVNAIAAVEDQAPAVGAGLERRHGGLKQAHDDAPVPAAERQFYED